MVQYTKINEIGESTMAAVKKKKVLQYNGKPLNRVGDRLYYGNLEDKYILVLDILEKEKSGEIENITKVKMSLMDNTGELGNGQVYRKSEKENLYKALDIGEWWLQDALQNQ